MKIPVENRSSDKRVEIPVKISEETEEERTTIYKELPKTAMDIKHPLDIKTRIILILIWIVFVFLITSRPSGINKLMLSISTNKIQMEQTAQTLSWLMVRQKELEQKLSEEFGLVISK